MELDHQVTEHEVQDSGDFESVGYSMDEKQTHLLFEVLSQYSNPIGSIVREITTNGFDAHIEAGKTDKPVTVRLTDSNELTGTDNTFEVEDQGVGLSPERVKTIYTKFLSSTKRSGNEQHGAFGLGSKSPLSYTDVFFVTTFYDGKKYDYWIHKAHKVPTLEKVGEEPTDRENGTIVQVPIKEGDKPTFRREIRRQLRYFDNVIYKNCAVNNDFTIYEGDNFLYCPEASDDSMHLVIGKVYYPLDLKAAGLKSGYSTPNWSKVPLALKFEIGDLPLIWNRENIKYTDEAIELIEEKIAAVKKELQEVYDKQFDNIDSLPQFLKAIKSKRSNSLKLADGVELNRISNIISTNVSYPKYTDTVTLPTSLSSIFAMYKVHKIVDCGLINQKNIYTDVEREIGNPDNLSTHLWLAEEAYSTKKNKYINEELLKGTRFLIIREDTSFDKDRVFGYDEKSDKEKKLVDQFIEEVKQYVEKHTHDYDGVTVTEEFEEILAQRRAATASKEQKAEDIKDQKFHIKYVDESNTYRSECEFRQHYIKGRNLLTDNNLMIYGHRDESDQLLAVAYLMAYYEHLHSGYSSRALLDPEKVKIFKISQSNARLIEDKPNAIFVQDLIDTDNRIFRRVATYKYLQKNEFSGLVNRTVRSRVKKYFPELAAEVNLIDRLIGGLREPSAWLPSTPRFIFKEIIEEASIYDGVDEALDLIKKCKRRYPLIFALDNTDVKANEDEIKFYTKAKGEVSTRLLHKFEQQKLQQELTNE